MIKTTNELNNANEINFTYLYDELSAYMDGFNADYELSLFVFGYDAIVIGSKMLDLRFEIKVDDFTAKVIRQNHVNVIGDTVLLGSSVDDDDFESSFATAAIDVVRAAI